MYILRTIYYFFADNFPTVHLIIRLFPVTILWSFLALYLAGFCKKNLNWKTGYTRKLFHFLIFITAFFYQSYFQLPGVFILGWSVTIILIYACFKGNGNLFYEALARENDEPHRTKYIVYSYSATFLGGMISNILFGKFALFGYAITGIADAIAEPIGIRFGKHQYRVFSFDKNKITHRSLEGSLAVLIASFIVPIFILHYFDSTYTVNYFLLFTAAVICTVTEAVSPSGFDNFLLQLVASFLFSLIAGYHY